MISEDTCLPNSMQDQSFDTDRDEQASSKLTFCLIRTPQSFSVKDQVVNILDFVGHILSVTTTQLQHSRKAAVNSILVIVRYTLLTKTGNRQHAGFGQQPPD